MEATSILSSSFAPAPDAASSPTDGSPYRDDAATARLAARGCIASRNALVETHLPFVVRLARDHRGMGIPVEDLVHDGVLGLIEAARRFDPDRGNRFLTFASWWIRKALLGALARGTGVVPVPSYQRRRMAEIREAESELHRALGRRPRAEEVSARLGRSVERVHRTLRRQRREVRIDHPTGSGDDRPLVERLSRGHEDSPEADLLRGELDRSLRSELDRLGRREREVLSWRFGLDGEPPRSLQEISLRIGVSRERVRQIELEARGKLRKRLARRRLVPLD